ncbi:hypothetical protein SAMN04490248_11363 [Salinihabitans flavidus]|uniref:Uncharacterized protein n=1 Tax=Salinihabitans flavidus TaxID=569882 RepID=A0A1H8SV80_9RHOB|nr:argininosuccinate lyase [Salinihabitans flavidus]SEO82571.1 hypothetical protein SAMN04490248_11363 [Salinihabitans flavidus]
MKTLMALIIAAVVAGCGVDGAPVAPTRGAQAETAPEGVSVSGNAQVGVVF